MFETLGISLPFLSILAALAFGYALGSVPFGLLLTRAAGLGDVRAIGSGNIGATNVLRTGNKGLAAATLLLDMLKGTLAVWAAGQLWHGSWLVCRAWRVLRPYLSGLAAFQGRQGRRHLSRHPHWACPGKSRFCLPPSGSSSPISSAIPRFRRSRRRLWRSLRCLSPRLGCKLRSAVSSL